MVAHVNKSEEARSLAKSTVAPIAAGTTGSASSLNAGYDAFRAFAHEGIDHLQIWISRTTSTSIKASGEVLELLDDS
jgi:hypothetical protein